MGKLEEFLDSQHHLAETTKVNYRMWVKKFEAAARKPFEDVYLDGVVVHRVLAVLDGQLADSTWNLALAQFQRFAKWLNGGKTCPEMWWEIEFKKIDWDEKLKDKWFSEEEFYDLLDATDHPRAKAMYGMCCEGGLRAGELLSLKIRHCQATSYGFDVTFSGKTGTRSVPIVLCAPLLRQWLNSHPGKHNPESALWVHKVRDVNAALGYNTANREFKKYARRAGIKRNVSLHVLRHTKVTWTAKNPNVHVSDKVANAMFGWSEKSNMYKRYTHLVGRESRETFLRLAGVEEVIEKIEKPSVLKRRKCVGCGELNSAEALYCDRCGTVLDEEEARKLVKRQRLLDWMAEMLKDPEARRRLFGDSEVLKGESTE